MYTFRQERVEAWKRSKLERKKAVWRKRTKKEEENIGEESYCWLTTEINIASTEQQDAKFQKKNFFRELKPGVTNKNKNRNENNGRH